MSVKPFEPYGVAKKVTFVGGSASGFAVQRLFLLYFVAARFSELAYSLSFRLWLIWLNWSSCTHALFTVTGMCTPWNMQRRTENLDPEFRHQTMIQIAALVTESSVLAALMDISQTMRTLCRRLAETVHTSLSSCSMTTLKYEETVKRCQTTNSMGQKMIIWVHARWFIVAGFQPVQHRWVMFEEDNFHQSFHDSQVLVALQKHQKCGSLKIGSALRF